MDRFISQLEDFARSLEKHINVKNVPIIYGPNVLTSGFTSRFHKSSFLRSFFTLLAKSAFVPYIMGGNVTF